MTQKIRFFWRTGLLGFHALTLLVLIFAFAAAGFVWRVSSSPLDIGFAKSYIQDALYDKETGNHALVDKVVLYWPELSKPLYIQLQGSKILNRRGDTLISVDDIAISFTGYGLLMGKVMPKTIVLKSPLLHVTRLEDNSLDFGFESNDAVTAPEGEQETMIARILGYLARPGHESANNSILSHLEALEIKNARLVVSDYVLGLSWYVPDFSAGFFSTDEGMQAQFNLDLPQGGGQVSGVNVDLRYDWADKTADFSLDIDQFDLMVLAGKMPEIQVFDDMHKIVNAHVQGRFGQGFTPESLSGTLDIDGLKIKSNVAFSSDESGVKGKAELTIDEVAQAKMDSIWPKQLRGDGSETWIVHRMADGIFKNVRASVDLAFPKLADGSIGFTADNILAGFAFENMSVDYRHPLPPVTKAYGDGSFDLTKDEMRIAVSKGFLGKMEIVKSDLLFDRLVEHGKGDVDIKTHLKGGVQDVLRFVSTEPINMGNRLDMDLDKVKGSADLNVHLKFPAHAGVKMEDFKIGVDGKLKDVLFPDLVSGLDVTGGSMVLGIKDGVISAEGKGKLENRDMDFEWSEFLESEGKPHKSKVTAALQADPNLRQLLGIDLSDFIEGTVGVHADYTSYQDGKALIGLDVDLTPAMFFVEPFDYRKPAGEAASAKMTAHMANKELQEITDLTASGKDFTLSKSDIKFKKNKDETQLLSGNLSAFKLLETQGKLTFKFDENGTVKIVMDAPFLDVQPFMAAKETTQAYEEPPMIISVTAKTMRTAPKETVSDAKMFIDIDGQGRFNQMEMDATAGKSQIYMRYKPNKEGKRTFNLQTDDAGAALKAFQVYSSIRGGKMVIYGEPVGGVMDRNLVGAAEITDFYAVDAPILTQLLSLMSLSGIADLMTGEGLNFSRLEADFNWVSRKGGALLELKNGRTSGNSIGLTFDGTFDNAKRFVDVGGTIVPISSINNILGDIPLVGDILTGGSGGIFAATYSIKGESDKIEVSVNPLSVLTPGIIRRILFEQ